MAAKHLFSLFQLEDEKFESFEHESSSQVLKSELLAKIERWQALTGK